MILRPPRYTLFPYNDALPILEERKREWVFLTARRVRVVADGFQRQHRDDGFAPLSRTSRVACAAHVLGLKMRSEEHTSELQSPCNLVCRLLLEKKKP